MDMQPLPEQVYVDREMWEKIVLNLISNALKFTMHGHISVSLSAPSSGTLCFFVSLSLFCICPSPSLPAPDRPH
jgi:signal transduction histidine kinase